MPTILIMADAHIGDAASSTALKVDLRHAFAHPDSAVVVADADVVVSPPVDLEKLLSAARQTRTKPDAAALPSR